MRIIGKLVMASIVAGSVTVAQGAFAQTNDTQLSREAETLISKHPSLQADSVYVEVVDGVAYVHGNLSTSLESVEAVNIVAGVRGINRVVDATSVDNS